jgi:tetratricopeptide (TPR) repeat protein
MDSSDSLAPVRTALKAGRRSEARTVLLQAVEIDPQNERAWLLLGDLSPDLDDRIISLENVLVLNPAHAKAKRRLVRLRRLREDPLAQGAMHQERGEIEQAIAAYLNASTQARSPADRKKATERLAFLQHWLDSPKIEGSHPTVQLLRLAAGPPLLYGLLILIQSGLNPLDLSLLFILGWLSVFLGSLLIGVTGAKHKHPRWDALFWDPAGVSEPVARFVLSFFGWIALLAPFLLLLRSALQRLDAFRATLS